MARPPTNAGRLPEHVRRHLEEGDLLRRGQAVVVALSGGLDSMVLLHLLRFPLNHLGLRLTAAHLDHAMRPGSGADALWVSGVCTAWGVPCHQRRLDPAARSEADARDRRYAFLEDVAGADATAAIATAHHQDDQAETVLFRAIRGTGIRGLRGIAPRRGRVIRPLLPFGRAELAGYAEAVGLRYRVDPTNRDLSYARNRIRHEALPVLEAAHPGAARSLARLADRARAEERSWHAVLERLEAEVVIASDSTGAVLARPVLHSYHPALRVRVVRHLLRRHGSAPGRAGTHAALKFISSGRSGGELHLTSGVRLVRDFDEIRIVSGEAPSEPDQPLTIPGPEPGTGRARIGGRRVEVVWGGAVAGSDPCRISLADPSFPLTIRGWRPGDRIRFQYGGKKLKELFRERRLDRRARRAAPVVVDGTGRIVWVAGVARAEGVGEDGVGFHIAVSDARQR